MLRSLYISASGMFTQRKAMDVLTNNLANASTVGFKRDTLATSSFHDALVGRINDPEYNASGIGTIDFGVHPDATVTGYEQGPMEATGRMADLALAGDGFFVVETPQGLRFTRSGNFQVDAAGYLCTPEGYFVRGTGGRIRVGFQGFSVDAAGNVASAAGASRLQLVSFANNGVLRKAGGNLFSGPLTAQNAACQVRQGFLEASNVDVAQEMVNMIAVQRNYESNSSALKMIDGTLQKAVSEIGRV